MVTPTQPIPASHRAVWPPPFRIVDQATVDDETWYTIRSYRKPVAAWVREHNPDLWVELTDDYPFGNQFDIHEKLFTLLALTWPDDKKGEYA